MRADTSLTGESGKSGKRVLVIRIGRMGDTILATPIIEVLQQALGQAVVIAFVASPGASPALMELDRRVNKVFPVRQVHRVSREFRGTAVI